MVTRTPMSDRYEDSVARFKERSKEELELAEQLLNHSQAGRVGIRHSEARQSPETLSNTGLHSTEESSLNHNINAPAVASSPGLNEDSIADGSYGTPVVTGQICRYACQL